MPLPLPLPVVVILALLALPTPPADHQVMSGYLSGYDQLPTDATIAYRQEIGQLPADLSQYDALVAVLDCAQIGRAGTLYTAVGPLHIVVFDCAGVDDGGHQWMVNGRYVAELDWYTRQQHPELMGTAAVLLMDNQ